MKKITVIALYVLMVTGIVSVSSCKKDKDPYTCTTCINTPDANAAYDGKSAGVYKGVVVGSSGTIRFNIANDGSSISAVMVLDGETVNLTSQVAWVDGQSYAAPFTGVMNGQNVTINFSVGMDGTGIILTGNIPGHPDAILQVYKETSTSQVVCYEGTFDGDSHGIFNMILSTTLKGWSIVALDSNGNGADFNGTINGNSLDCDCSGNSSTVGGTLSGDEVNGTWSNTNGSSGNWTGQRSM